MTNQPAAASVLEHIPVEFLESVQVTLAALEIATSLCLKLGATDTASELQGLRMEIIASLHAPHAAGAEASRGVH